MLLIWGGIILRMKAIFSGLTLSIPAYVYVKDSQSSDLGRRILEHSIIIIRKYGIDKLTFRKLAATIDSNGSYIYRYFENKHALMLYLISWYWLE